MREIARLTHTQPGTLHKELTKLAQAGNLKKTEQSNQLWYQATTRCAVFGSVASGKATATSDIDLLLVGDLSFTLFGGGPRLP